MSITSRINEMSSHIEQAYDELQGLGADLTNVNKNIENISMVLDDIYDSLPSVSGEGTSLTLDDTRVGKIKSTLKGNTSQDGTPTPTTPIPVNVVSGDNEIVVSGTNMLDISQLQTQTISGITITNNGDGSITMNGTSTSAITLDIPITHIPLSANKTYTFGKRYTFSGGSYAISLRKSDSTNISGTSVDSSNKYMNFTPTENVEAHYMRIFIVNNKTFSNHTIFPMLNIGSTEQDYVKFNGLNTYNIDLPVENLFDKDNATIFNAYLSGNSIISYATNQTTYIPVVEGETYTISKKVGASNLAIAYTTSTPTVGGSTLGTTNTGATKYTTTAPSTAKYLCVFIKGSADSSYTLEQILGGIQIEKSSKANSYTPYGTTPIELCKIGNYQDYFYKDSDKWYLHKEINKVVLNGTSIKFDYRQSTNTSGYARYETNLDLNGLIYTGTQIADVFSDKLVKNSINNIYTRNQGVSISGNGTRLNMYIEDVAQLSGNDANTWLTTNNIIVYYQLATPINTEITYQPLIDQLNLLEKAISYEGQTNISQVNNDLPFKITASALKEWSV